MKMPPIIAPGMLPMPPTTAAVNAFSPARKPIVFGILIATMLVRPQGIFGQRPLQKV